MSKWKTGRREGYSPSDAERALAGVREALAAYLHRCGEGAERVWAYGALREFCNLSSLLETAAPRPVWPGACIEAAADAAVILAAAGGYRLEAGLDSAPAGPALLDAAALRTAFFNLVGNACRHASDGAARLQVTYGEGKCRIAVTNRAGGYPAAALGLAAARAAAGRLSGSLRVLICGDRLTAALIFPLRPATAQPVTEIPNLVEYLGNPFSPAYIGLADLGYIPGCAGGKRSIY